MRDLLVSKDESTLLLLEATPSVKQRYLKQTEKCPVSFLFKALEAGTNCDLTFKSSKNPRLHIELSLIKICRLNEEIPSEPEKKNSDPKHVKRDVNELPAPSKSEIIRQDAQVIDNTIIPGQSSGKHVPVIDKPSKTFSIKEMISTEPKPAYLPVEKVETDISMSNAKPKEEFSPVAFEDAWKEFTLQLFGEGARVASMFKTIIPEVENDHTIKIHLSNATQKDTFILNYRQRLVNFLEEKFILPEINIETSVDLIEKNEVLYTDDQKYNYLISKFPILKEMKKAFNLDLT
jgi:DNA polymerase-3 subunit gamma/tau